MGGRPRSIDDSFSNQPRLLKGTPMKLGLTNNEMTLVELDKADFLISEAQSTLGLQPGDSPARASAVARLAEAMALMSRTIRARAGLQNRHIDSTQNG
jgi:hypothetical protein